MLDRVALLGLLALGCGDSPATADAGGHTLTVVASDGTPGIIESIPAGISCGTCALPGSGCTDTTPHTACSADFTPGAKLDIALSEEDVDHSVACHSPTDPNLVINITHSGSCSFTFESSLTLDVTGVAQ